MARYRDANCKLCRREREKLFLKGHRCVTDKCAFERRAYAPGQHGQRMRFKVSNYGKGYFKKAEKTKGVTGEILLQLLESRLDNIVYRLGFAPSRKAARQLVRHRHFHVNDRIVDIPSFQVKPNDIIKVRDKSKNLDIIHSSLKEFSQTTELAWLRLNKAALEGELLEIPSRENIPITANEQLIVELYSK